MKDIFRYDKMVETALRGVVKEALAKTAKTGLPGSHHFYITFRTEAEGVELPDHLRAKYPGEMTVVLEHQFWDLEVDDRHFAVTLSFANRPERISIPLGAITAFADPSVKFGLQFQDGGADPAVAERTTEKANEKKKAESDGAKLRLAAAAEKAEKKGEEEKPAKPPGGGEVVTLDAFRKK
jgi:hypothetical protein